MWGCALGDNNAAETGRSLGIHASIAASTARRGGCPGCYLDVLGWKEVGYMFRCMGSALPTLLHSWRAL